MLVVIINFFTLLQEYVMLVVIINFLLYYRNMSC